LNNQKVIVNVVYRPPKNKLLADFFMEFEDMTDTLHSNSGKLLICGDFNVHVDATSNINSQKLQSILNSKDLVQHILYPTHSSGHILDLVISRLNELHFWNFKYDHSVTSDHCCLMFTSNIPKPPKPVKEVFCRKWKNINVDCLNSDLDSAFKHTTHDDVVPLVDHYNNSVVKVINKHAPATKRTVTVHHQTLWYTDEIRQAKRERRRLERVMRKSKLTVHRDIHNKQRNVVNELIERAKKDYFTEAINKSSTSKEVFQIGNSLLFKKKECSLPSHTSAEQLANKFSDFFHNKIVRIRTSLTSDRCSTDSTSTTSSSQNSADIPQLTTFVEASEAEISKLISRSPTKSCSLDPIPTWLLKSCLPVFVPILTRIVNSSLAQGIVPEGLKEALVTPLLKKPGSDPEILKNYRPVSNLTFVSKVIERTVATRLQKHMTDNNLGEVLQSAYKCGHSTESALLRVQNDILSAVDTKGAALLVLLDLSAAFDTVDHPTLLSRLQDRIGVTGVTLTWITSYLSGRHQSVIVGGESSPRRGLEYGVPQGSVLGPILFTIYTLPLGDIARRHQLEFHLYADDTQLYLGFRPLDGSSVIGALDRVSNCIDDIRKWMKVNFLMLNDDKTEVLIICPKAVQPKLSSVTLTIGDLDIKPSQCARNLGVIFDSSMSLEKHTLSICRKAYFQMRQIGQISRYLDEPSVKLLVHAFVTSRLDYCNSLMYGANQYLINKVQRVQNSAARLISRTRKYDHVTPVLKQLHWLPIRERIVFKILVFTFKALHNLGPEYIQDIVKIHKPTRALRSQFSVMAAVPRTRTTTYGDRTFAKSGPTLWNALPETIRAITRLSTFKKELKTLLFKRAYD